MSISSTFAKEILSKFKIFVSSCQPGKVYQSKKRCTWYL